MWFIFALLTALGWGIADIFYKRASSPKEKYSHLLICIFDGVFFGINAIVVLLTQDIGFNPINIIYYLPVSMCYFLSMVLVFYGLKYIEDSISSPVENSSGAITALLCFLVLGQRMSKLSLIGVILVTIGVVALGVFEARGDSEKRKSISKKKLMVAFFMPVCYSIFNALGGLLDAYYLDASVSPLKNVTEDTISLVANCSYELFYLVIAVLFTIFLIIKKEKFDIKEQKFKLGCGIFEMVGQLSYVYAMTGNAIVAAPIVSSVCVVSVILARIFLKEKLSLKQYLAVLSVIAGIIVMSFDI